MMKKATRKDLSRLSENLPDLLDGFNTFEESRRTLKSDHFKRMEHAEKLLTKIHDEKGVSTLQQQLHDEYIKSKPKQAPEGRKSREREAAEATPTFLRVMCPRKRRFQRSNKEEKEAPANIFFEKSSQKDKNFRSIILQNYAKL